MASTKDVLDHHLSCMMKGDVEGTLSDYATDALVLSPMGPIRGHAAMRPGLQALIAEFVRPGVSLNVKQQCVDGEYAYLVWTAETPDNTYDLGSDTFHIKDGKIVAQSYVFNAVPKKAL